MTALDLPELDTARQGFSLRRKVALAVASWVRRHATSIAVLVPILAAVAAVHAIGMSTFPRWVDDPGTYLSQAWSFQYEHALSPYSYTYDHAPAGWIQIALWSMLTNGFNRHSTAIGFGNEVMLLAKLVSSGLLYVLGRRLGFSRPAAAVVVLLFGLCPLELVYSRWTYLDNLVTPWLLLAFVLACSPSRRLSAATGAALAFAMACLTKETALVLLPAFLWVVAQNLDRRNRSHVLTMAGFSGVMLGLLYPLYAVYKGELLESTGRNSLLGTAKWQLVQRESSGSLLDPGSTTFHMAGTWLALDRYLLLAGLVAIPVAMFARRLRPVALALAIEWLVLVRGGYVPFMQVVNVLPWSALLVVGAFVSLRLSPRVRRFANGAAVAALALVVAFSWTPSLHRMMTVRQEPPLRAATRWVADNVPRNRELVVHDSIWTDLVQKYGFQPRPVIVYKLDTDPAVRQDLRRIDYLVLPNWYYATPAAASKYPTVLEARKHAVAVARFGSGDDGVQVLRVSRYWRPDTAR